MMIQNSTRTIMVVAMCVTFMELPVQASETKGQWIIVDNQSAVDAGGGFGRTATFSSSNNDTNYNGNHEYFKRTHTGAPIIQNGTIGGAVPDGSKWLILDSRQSQFAWGRLGQSLGDISEGAVYNWSIKIGDRTDTPLPGGYTFGLFSLVDGDLKEISVMKKSGMAPVSGVLSTNLTWDSTSSGLDGKPLYFVIALNANSGTTAEQLLCDSISVTTSSVELVTNGGFENGLESWNEIPFACTWTFKNLPAGDYEVAAAWLEAGNRDTTAPFGINGTTNVYVNQRIKPCQLLLHDSRAWIAFDLLGTFAVDNGQMQVSLTPDSMTDYVIADAVAVRQISWTPEEFTENGSFENPIVPVGSVSNWGTAVPGWMAAKMTHPPQIVSETFSAGCPPAPNGNQWGLVDFRAIHNGGGSIAQCLDTVDEGRLYRWQVTLGNRSDVGYGAPTVFGLYSVSNGVFKARSVKLAEDVTMPQQSGGTQHFNVVWDSAGSGADGEQLYFKLDVPVYSGSSTVQLLIDGLKVSATKLRGTVILVH